MDEALSVVGVAVLSISAAMIIKSVSPDFSRIVTVGAGILILIAALKHISGITAAIETIARSGGVPSDMIAVILKAAGITIVLGQAAEAAEQSGEKALASQLELFSRAAVCAMALPFIAELFEIMTSFL